MRISQGKRKKVNEISVLDRSSYSFEHQKISQIFLLKAHCHWQSYCCCIWKPPRLWVLFVIRIRVEASLATSFLDACYKLSCHTWYQCQTVGWHKAELSNRNTASAKEWVLYWYCLSSGKSWTSLFLEQLSRGAQRHQRWHGSPSCTSPEDALVLRWGTAVGLPLSHAANTGMSWRWPLTGQ